MFDVNEALQSRIKSREGEILTEYAGYKASDFRTYAEAELESILATQNTQMLTGVSVFLDKAVGTELQGTDVETRSSAVIKGMPYIRMYKMAPVMIRCQKNALNTAEVVKVARFGAQMLANALLRIRDTREVASKRKLTLIRTPVEVGFRQDQNSPDSFYVEISCKFGLDFVDRKKE